MAPSATIEPRLRKRPAPAAVLPNTTTVPAIIALAPQRRGALARHGEKVAQSRASPAVYHGQLPDGARIERRKPVGGDAVRDERVRGRRSERQHDPVAHAMIFLR